MAQSWKIVSMWLAFSAPIYINHHYLLNHPSTYVPIFAFLSLLSPLLFASVSISPFLVFCLCGVFLNCCRWYSWRLPSHYNTCKSRCNRSSRQPLGLALTAHMLFSDSESRWKFTERGKRIKFFFLSRQSSINQFILLGLGSCASHTFPPCSFTIFFILPVNLRSLYELSILPMIVTAHFYCLLLKIKFQEPAPWCSRLTLCLQQ